MMKVTREQWFRHAHRGQMRSNTGGGIVRVTAEPLSHFDRKTRLASLRWMHPYSTDEEIMKYRDHILDPPDLGPRPAWMDKLSLDDNDDLGAGIETTLERSAAYERAGKKCHCGAVQNYVTPTGPVGVALNPHHRHYRSEGVELPSDYLILCERCHLKEHHKFGRYVMDLYEEGRRGHRAKRSIKDTDND